MGIRNDRRQRYLSLLCFATLLSGCVGSPIHSTLKYNEVQSRIKESSRGLLKLSRWASLGDEDVCPKKGGGQ